MLKLLAVVGTILIFGSIASATEIIFHAAGIHYKAKKDKGQFLFADNLGTRRLEAKTCNRKLVDAYWKELYEPIARLKKRKLPSKNVAAWVKVNGVKYDLTALDSTYKKLRKKPQTIHGLFIESHRRCSKKSSS